MLESVHFEITDLCNLGCKVCYNAKRHKSKKDTGLDERGLSIVAERLKDIPTIILTGGEPLRAREKVYYFLEQLTRKEGQKATLNTNLISVEEDDISRLTDLGVKYILASTHFLDLPKSVSQEAQKNLTRLTNAGFDVAVNMVVTQNNYHDVYETGKRFSEQGIIQFSATPISLSRANYKTQRNLALDRDKTVEALSQLYRLEKETGMPTDILRSLPYCMMGDNEHLKKYFTKSCRAGKDNMVISANGQARPCIMIPEEYGSILDHSVEELLDRIKQGYKRQALAVCGGCSLEELCGGGCEENIRAISQNNDPLGYKPEQYVAGAYANCLRNGCDCV